MMFLNLTTCKLLAAEMKFRPSRLCFVANESPSEGKPEDTPKAPPKSFAEVGDELNEEASREALAKAKANRTERKEVVAEDRNQLAALRAQLGEPGQKPKDKPEEDKKGKEDEGKKKEKKKGAPERSPEAMTGKQFLEAFAKCKTQEERQKLILAQANANAFSPDSLKTKSYETTTSKGVKIRVNMYDGIEFGVPGDSVRVCMDGPTSQAIADMLGGVLPSPEFYNRMYADPSVPKVPFFSGEQLESAVNAWRKENGIPTNLNINYIDERGKPVRNGAAMKSSDYMYMHHKFLEYWMDKHNIDRSRVNVGSRKTVFAPVADDGKIAFGGGLYAMPVVQDGKIVDYELTSKLVQGDGSIDGNFSVDHHAHEPPYFDYASGTSVVKSVDVGKKNVPILEFMTSEEYAEMRTEIFGKRSSASNRYKYPEWMSEYVQDYRQKHGGDVVLDASDVSPKPANTPIFEGIPQAEIQKGKVVEEFDYTVAQGAPGGHVKFVKTSAGNVAVMDWQGKEYQVKVDFNNASGVEKQKDGYAASGGEIAGPFAYILLRYFREHEGKVGDLIPFEYNGKQYVAEYQIHPPDASSSINHPGVGIMEKKNTDQYSQIPSSGWKPSPDSKPSEGGSLGTAIAAPKSGATPSGGPGPGPALPPSGAPRKRVASGGGMPSYGGGAPAYTPSGAPSYTPSYTPAVYTPAPGGGTEAYYRPTPAPVVKTSPAEKKETGERPVIKGNTLFCGDSMTVAMPESSGRRNLNVDGEIDTIAQGSKTTAWLLEQLQSYEKTDRIKSMKNMVVLIGTNDVGGNESAQAIFDRIQKIWEIGKRNNLKVYACTIPPFKGWKNFESRFDSVNQKRKDINELIMKSGTPDMVVKLHELMADPNDPDKLADEYNYNGKGDHLHPDKVKHARLIESVIGERTAPSDKPATPEKPAEAIDSTSLAGFETDPYLQEKTKTYNYPEGDPEPLRVHVNAPANFDRKKPTRMVVFTLPAGNTIEQTIGAKKQPGQDWHYEIQQIGAQVRKLREISPGENIVVAYVEAPNLNPGGWKKDQPGRGQVMAQLFEDVRAKLAVPQVTIDISGHSAGRSLKFSYIDEQPQIPDNVKRLSFLDSNHSYNPARGEKIVKWLKATNDHYLTVISYDDRNVTYQGKPVAGAVGYERTYEMIAFFQQQGITLTKQQKNGYVQYSGLDGRVNFLVMDNPQNKILHTETVFRNGLLYAETSGTGLEAAAGQFNGPLTFEQYIQDQPSQLALSTGSNPEPPKPETPKEEAETAEVLLDFKYGLAGQPATKPARLMKGAEGTYVEFELGKLYVNLETGNPDIETIKKNHDPATFAEAGHIAYLLLHLNGALKRPMNSVIGYKYNGREGVARYEIHNDGPNGPNPNDHEGVGIWMKTTVVA